MSHQQLSSSEIAVLLEQAIVKNHIVMFYQPKVSAKTGEVVGVEALMRWIDPEHGFIPPSVFIPIAEKAGLIGPLTLNAIQSAVRQGALWNIQGIRLNIAINVSIQDLHNPDIVTQFADALKDNSIDATQITFEITETAIMEDHKQCAAVIGTLRAMGAGISVDDFGTGHASFVYLKHFPITEIKIDKMFVDDVLKSHLDQKIIKFTTELAHEIGCKVVAEGIEDESTAKVLRDIGCDTLQGYHFCKPMNVNDVVDFIQSNQMVEV